MALSDIVELDASLKAEYIGKLELDWESYLEKKKRELGGKAFEHSPTDCMVIHSSLGYIGTTDDLIKWAGSKYGFEVTQSLAMESIRSVEIVTVSSSYPRCVCMACVLTVSVCF